MELHDAEGRVVWSSPEVPRSAVPELNLVLGRGFLERSPPPVRLVLLGIDGGREERLEAVPLELEDSGEGRGDGHDAE